jgi:hypothetical protein
MAHGISACVGPPGPRFEATRAEQVVYQPGLGPASRNRGAKAQTPKIRTEKFSGLSPIRRGKEPDIYRRDCNLANRRAFFRSRVAVSGGEVEFRRVSDYGRRKAP